MIIFPPRTIFCNPIDERVFKRSIKSDDIKLLTSTYIQRDKYIAGKDISVTLGLISSGYEEDDFMNNKFTVVYGTVFN